MRNHLWFIAAVIGAICSGCTASSNPLLSSGPDPRIEDCALVQQATPTRYVCGGKTYTAVQLTSLRNSATAQSTNGSTVNNASANRSPVAANP
jgi:hypothetical protein